MLAPSILLALVVVAVSVLMVVGASTETGWASKGAPMVALFVLLSALLGNEVAGLPAALLAGFVAAVVMYAPAALVAALPRQRPRV